MDNLTYFVWFFTAFFWVFFNLYFCFADSTFAYDPQLMMAGSLICAVLQWGLLLACILRSNTAQREEANAVQSVNMDSIWRSTQLFYLTAPLQLYSIIMGIKDYIDGKRYGIDSTFWTTGDRGGFTKTIVKWWTLAIIVGAVVAWVYVIYTAAPVSNIAAVVIVTMTALDVLHPCAYLWLDKCPEAWEAWQKTQLQKVKEGEWDKRHDQYYFKQRAKTIGLNEEHIKILTDNWKSMALFAFSCDKDETFNKKVLTKFYSSAANSNVGQLAAMDDGQRAAWAEKETEKEAAKEVQICAMRYLYAESRGHDEGNNKETSNGLGAKVRSIAPRNFDCSFLLMGCWWGTILHSAILKSSLLRVMFKYLGLVQQVVLPFMAFFNPYLGVASALFSLSRAGK